MSSQDELLSVLLPKAKNVKWEGGRPTVVEAQEEWSSGFKNFVSAEELGLLVRHAEQPHRVSLHYILTDRGKFCFPNLSCSMNSMNDVWYQLC